MKTPILAALILTAAGIRSYGAAIGLDLFVETLRNQSGTALPNGTLVQLVVDTANNGFGEPGRVIVNTDTTFSSTVSALSFVGASVDDVVVASFAISSANSGSNGGLFESIQINYDPNTYRSGLTIVQGMPMLLRWWPGKTTGSLASSVQVGNVFGEFRSSSVLDGSSIAWVTPSVGSNNSINVRNVGNPDGGTASIANATARGVVVVPEPGVASLVLLGVVAFSVRRKRA